MKEALKCAQDRGDTVASDEVSSDVGADLTRLLLPQPSGRLHAADISRRRALVCLTPVGISHLSLVVTSGEQHFVHCRHNSEHVCSRRRRIRLISQFCRRRSFRKLSKRF